MITYSRLVMTWLLLSIFILGGCLDTSGTCPETGLHVYTISRSERDALLIESCYKYEGIAGYVFLEQDPFHPTQLKEFFRLYNPTTGGHLYTHDENEKASAINSGYQQEPSAGLIFPDKTADTVALYRVYNPENGDHFYTTDDVERSNAMSNNYQNEGIAGYLLDPKMELEKAASKGGQPLYRIFHP